MSVANWPFSSKLALQSATRILLHLTIVGLLFPTGVLLGNGASESLHPIEVKASFGNLGPIRRIKVSLGELPADEHVEAVIRLVNITQYPVEFLTLRPSCNCLKAKVENTRAMPNESADVHVTLHTRMTSFHPGQVTEFQVETRSDGRVETTTISIEYQLLGLLAFPIPVFHHEIPLNAKNADLRIPMMVTQPIIAADLDVESQLNVMPEIIQDKEVQEKWWLVFSIDPNLLQRDISLVSVKVSDAVTGRKAEATISLSRTLPFRVVPHSIRFRLADDGSYVATSIIRVAPDEEQPTPRGNEPPVARKLAATAKVRGKRLSIRTTPLNSNTFRVETTFHPNEEEPESAKNEVVWELICGKSKAEVRSPFLIENR